MIDGYVLDTFDVSRKDVQGGQYETHFQLCTGFHQLVSS